MNRKERIIELLTKSLSPVLLEVNDFSHQHSKGAETHFDVFIVSPMFEGKRQVLRHRMVYQSVQSETDSGLHALQLQTLTPTEHQTTTTTKLTPPKCQGGS